MEIEQFLFVLLSLKNRILILGRAFPFHNFLLAFFVPFGGLERSACLAAALAAFSWPSASDRPPHEFGGAQLQKRMRVFYFYMVAEGEAKFMSDVKTYKKTKQYQQ